VFSNWTTLVKINWTRSRAAEKNFGLYFALNLAVCFAIYMVLTQILIAHRTHEGIVVYDPVFTLYKPIDLSPAIFLCTYSGIFTIIFYLIPRPVVFMHALRGFVVLFALRLTFILLLPLHPAPDIITLKDPFTDNVIGFKGEVLNDLFFSGHIADLAFFVFCCQTRPLKFFLIGLTTLSSIMLVWQKVHYTADVLAAPFFAYACYMMFVKKYEKED
jgi:hypothetical protein